MSKLAEQEMDGEAIMAALGTQPGPDCLRDVVPIYGKRLKVYKAIKVCATIYSEENLLVCLLLQPAFENYLCGLANVLNSPTNLISV